MFPTSSNQMKRQTHFRYRTPPRPIREHEQEALSAAWGGSNFRLDFWRAYLNRGEFVFPNFGTCLNRLRESETKNTCIARFASIEVDASTSQCFDRSGFF